MPNQRLSTPPEQEFMFVEKESTKDEVRKKSVQHALFEVKAKVNDSESTKKAKYED